jgi:hypothetical protein
MEVAMANERTTTTGAPIANCGELEACEVVSCVTCLTEIPADVALTAEGPDYVQYFCGLDCLARWGAKQKA